jgi:uncharacterized protein
MNPHSAVVPRLISSRLEEAMADTPAVLLAGPRQAGKTTLVKEIARQQGLRYLTMDEELNRLAAQEDPVGMVRAMDRIVIDEIQRSPQLLLAIKKTIDEDRRPGRFLLTGSANLMALPSIADSLAGRMETLLLLPLSQSELGLEPANWVDHIFSGRLLSAKLPSVGNELVERVLKGGFPEPVFRETARRRLAWARQYVDALILRDVQDIASIDKVDQLGRFLRALASTAGQICNYARLGARVGLDGKTAARYISVFEQMYLLKRTEPWATNRLSRITKAPKLQFIDSGLLASLLGLTEVKAHEEKILFGSVLETFVYSELLKHATTSAEDYRIMHYRDAEKVEVDFVIENARGQIIGVEVKSSATVKGLDLQGLKKLAGLAGRSFRAGVLLYDGEDTQALGENLWAAPLSSLWGSLNTHAG